MSTVAYASEDVPDDPVDYTYIANASCALSINGSGLASCTASITGQAGVDSVRIIGYLQKDTGSWTTVKSWSQTWAGRYGNMGKTYYVPSGYDYRWKVYFTAYDGGNSETITLYTYDSY